MATAKEHFVVDEHGNKTAVLLDIERYQELIEAREEIRSAPRLRCSESIRRRGHSRSIRRCVRSRVGVRELAQRALHRRLGRG